MKVVILSLIILIGGLLRFLWLDIYPPGVTGDEIQQGYTAYSILKTGKDEWGEFLPINPKGFGDYKPPLYSYLSVAPVAVFGLNIFAVRFVSAFFGILTIWVTFFLAKKIFDNEKIGILAALFLAVSPWHIQYSRVGWESNIGLFFFCLGVWLFLKGLKSGWFLVGSSVSLGLVLFSYHSFKLFTILFVLGLLFFYRRDLLKINRLVLISSVIVFGLALILVLYGFIFSGAGRRAADAAIYNQENIVALRNTQVEDPLPQPWGRVINNRMEYIGSQFIQNYLGYFSTTFLFSPHRSNSSIFNLSGQGLLYIWQSFLLMIAVYLFIKEKIKSSFLILLWLVLSVVPAALTREYMIATRVEVYVYMVMVLTAFSGVHIWGRIKKFKTKFLILVLSAGILLWSLVGRVDYYLFHTFNKDQGGLQYGYNEVVGFTEANKDKYNQIIFTKKHSEPQAFVAFYSKMDPKTYQQYSKNWDFEERGFRYLDMTNFHLDKYFFKDVNWKEDQMRKNTLVVAAPEDVPPEVKVMRTIIGSKGEVLFKVIDTDDVSNGK